MSYTIAPTILTSGFDSAPIPIESYSFGAENLVTVSSTGSDTGRPMLTPLQVNKMLDASSANLYEAAYAGTASSDIKLSLTAAGALNSPRYRALRMSS